MGSLIGRSEVACQKQVPRRLSHRRGPIGARSKHFTEVAASLLVMPLCLFFTQSLTLLAMALRPRWFKYFEGGPGQWRCERCGCVNPLEKFTYTGKRLQYNHIWWASLTRKSVKCTCGASRSADSQQKRRRLSSEFHTARATPHPEPRQLVGLAADFHQKRCRLSSEETVCSDPSCFLFCTLMSSPTSSRYRNSHRAVTAAACGDALVACGGDRLQWRLAGGLQGLQCDGAR